MQLYARFVPSDQRDLTAIVMPDQEWGTEEPQKTDALGTLIVFSEKIQNPVVDTLVIRIEGTDTASLIN